MNSFEYRLRDDVKVCNIIDELVAYLVSRATSEEICRVYLRKVECTYYKVRPHCSNVAMDNFPLKKYVNYVVNLVNFEFHVKFIKQNVCHHPMSQ